MGVWITLWRSVTVNPEQVNIPTMGDFTIVKDEVASWWERPDIGRVISDNVQCLSDISLSEMIELADLLTLITDEAERLRQAIILDDPNVTYSAEGI